MPILLFYNILITLLAIMVGLAMFVESVSPRYAGRSVTFLGFGYFIGQSMICLVVGLGACALTFGGASGFR